ncbi:regulator of chromosome condensation 1 isoform X3 [Andrena cerasifolii]|uniref:regulator of chromosome condensation 1 isoform X3 n=1 Tax=Andrena cerasifolii TaxID=2819439 RepID=UPI004037D71E
MGKCRGANGNDVQFFTTPRRFTKTYQASPLCSSCINAAADSQSLLAVYFRFNAAVFSDEREERSTMRTPVSVPPRRASKRAAETPGRSTKEPKQLKQRIAVKPDLRRSLTSGVVLVFGQGDVGQLGLGEDIIEKIRPAVVPGYQDVVAIAAGGMHNVCLRETGEIVTFGCNDEGALGRDTSAEGSETKPGPVNLPGKVIQDSHGTMGLTLKGNEQFPIEMLPNVKIVKIASGADHLVLLNKNGHVYTCGCGEQGQLGRVAARAASRDTRHGMGPLLAPARVEFKITKKLEFGDIWAGTYCTFAKEYHSGDIYVFGLNNYHQIGLKEPRTHFHPQISKTFSGKIWKHISSGQHHTIALDNSGQVFVMGRKEYGRLGLGSNCSDAKELTAVPAVSSFKCVDVAAGSAQSFAVTESGDLYSWGMGTSGQLGTGEEDVEEPALVKGKQLEGKTIIRVAGGGQHTLTLATIHPAKEQTAG